MKRYTLPHPKGYYMVGDGQLLDLCRPDGTKAWSFDPGAVLECDVALAALEDHSELLTMTEEERADMLQGTATKRCWERVLRLIGLSKHQL